MRCGLEGLALVDLLTGGTNSVRAFLLRFGAKCVKKNHRTEQSAMPKAIDYVRVPRDALKFLMDNACLCDTCSCLEAYPSPALRDARDKIQAVLDAPDV
jgi:hypothetical protein